MTRADVLSWNETLNALDEAEQAAADTADRR